MFFMSEPDKFAKNVRSLETRLRKFGNALKEEGIAKADLHYDISPEQVQDGSHRYEVVSLNRRNNPCADGDKRIHVGSIQLLKIPFENCTRRTHEGKPEFVMIDELFGIYASMFDRISPMENVGMTVSIYGFGDYFGQFKQDRVVLPNTETYHTHLREIEELKRKIAFFQKK